MRLSFQDRRVTKVLEEVYLEIYFWSIVSTVLIRFTQFTPFMSMNWGLINVYLHLLLQIEPSQTTIRTTIILVSILEAWVTLDATLRAMFRDPAGVLSHAKDNYAPWNVLIEGDVKEIIYSPLIGCDFEELDLFEQNILKLSTRDNTLM